MLPKSPKQRASKITVSHREQVLIALTELQAYSKGMRSDIMEVKQIMLSQNGRVRKNEKAISKIYGIGSAVTTLFTAVMAWLFNK
jgi:hypothetical protein